ncbi:MAG: hypothetical protein PHR62_07320 [Paludibacter sp.]|nr:hypothetical protein [Paludibacter sp.]
MRNKTLFVLLFWLLISPKLVNAFAQDTIDTPTIEYTSPQKYEIAEITIKGADNYEDFVLIGFSGLAVGDVIDVPGEAVTSAVKRFWKQGLFADVKIYPPKI